MMNCRSKYYNKKTVVDGIEFDSRKEARRYSELLLLERAGAIQGLQRQVKFELIPSQRYDGKVIERPCTYIADFVYTDKEGRMHVEDVKGYKNGEAYAIFTIKRKMMLHLCGIRIEEV